MPTESLIQGVLDELADAGNLADADGRAARRIPDAVRLGGLWHRWIQGVEEDDARNALLDEIQNLHSDLAFDPAEDALVRIHAAGGDCHAAWTELMMHALTDFAKPASSPLALFVMGTMGSVARALGESACYAIAAEGCAIVVDSGEFERLHLRFAETYQPGTPVGDKSLIEQDAERMSEALLQDAIRRSFNIVIHADVGLANSAAALREAGYHLVAITCRGDAELGRERQRRSGEAIAQALGVEPCTIEEDDRFEAMHAIEAAAALARSGALSELIVLAPDAKPVDRLRGRALEDHSRVLAALGLGVSANTVTPESSTSPARVSSSTAANSIERSLGDGRKLRINLPPPKPVAISAPTPRTTSRTGSSTDGPAQASVPNTRGAGGTPQPRLAQESGDSPTTPARLTGDSKGASSERIEHRRSQIRKLCELARIEFE